MKKLLSIIVCLLGNLVIFAQEGVYFRDLTYEEALATAKAENKLLFVDCYTVWCGPCKQMADMVFPQKEAGDYFNPRFVCVKYNMEEGEGKELEQKWDVRAYPTFLIIRPSGEIQHIIVGGGELKQFIGQVEKGLNEKTSFGYLDNRYKQGKINKKELLEYITALQGVYRQEEADKVRKELMEKLSDKDKAKKDFWPLFMECAVGSEEFDFVLNHFETYQKNMGKEKMDRFLNDAYTDALYAKLEPIKQVPVVDIEKLKEQIGSLNSDCQPALILSCSIVEIALKKDLVELLNVFETRMEDMSKTDYWLMTSAFAKWQKKATKEELKRMAELSAKAALKCEGRMKESWEVLAEKYKSMSRIGVYFEELTLEEALAKAKKMRRKVFVDCYASWCGPCKQMTSQIFPQEKMGDFLNSRFVNVKYDMEKGEGVDICKKYNVRAFPTFLILNSDGTIYHKMVGGDNVEGFIKKLWEGLQPNNAFGYLEKQYQEGNRDKAFLAKYLKMLASLYVNDNQKVLGEFMETLSDEEKMSETYWFVFENPRLMPYESEYMKFLIENCDQFRKNIGSEKVNRRLAERSNHFITKVIMGKADANSVKELEQAKKDIEILGLGDDKNLCSNLRIAQAILTKNQNKILTVCEKEVDKVDPQKFPYMALLHLYRESATPAQKARWIKLGEKVAERIQYPSYKIVLETILKEYEAQK